MWRIDVYKRQDGEAVLDDVLAVLDGLDGHLVALRDVLQRGDGKACLLYTSVQDRFNNPFINHELMSISLNSTSKWKARNMPSFLTYIEECV